MDSCIFRARRVQFPARLRLRAPGTCLAAVGKFAFSPLLVLGVFSVATSGFSQNFPLNTVSYFVTGSLSGGSITPINFGGSDLAQSIDKVSLLGTFGDTHGTDGQSSGFVTVSATAETGSLRTKLSGNLSRLTTATDISGSATLHAARVQARWQDTYVIGGSINPVPGRLEHIKATLIVDGGFDIKLVSSPVSNNNRFAASTVSLRLDAKNSLSGDALPPPPYPNSPYFGEAAKNTLETVSFNHPPDRLIPVSFFARQGQAATLDFLMEVRATGRATVLYRANVENFFSTTFSGDFGHTLRWGGITSVTDAETGEPIEGWTITSASGFDYAHPAPVPEPASVGLALLGLLGLTCRRIRA